MSLLFFFSFRKPDKSLTEKEWQLAKRNFVLESVFSRLLTLLTSDQPSLLNCDFDNKVNVQTHWARGGERTPSDTFAQVGCSLTS